MMRLKFKRKVEITKCQLRPFEWGMNELDPSTQHVAQQLNCKLVKLVNDCELSWGQVLEAMQEYIDELAVAYLIPNPRMIKHKAEKYIHHVFVESWNIGYDVEDNDESWRKFMIEEAKRERGENPDGD